MLLLGAAMNAMIVKGHLTIVDAAGKRHRFEGAEPGPSLTIRLHRRNLALRLALRPDMTLGEAFIDGSLTIEDGDIFHALGFLLDNAERSGGFPLRRLGKTLGFWVRRLGQRNALGAARRNAARHYDLPGALYGLFLDADRQYSCA